MLILHKSLNGVHPSQPKANTAALLTFNWLCCGGKKSKTGTNWFVTPGEQEGMNHLQKISSRWKMERLSGSSPLNSHSSAVDGASSSWAKVGLFSRGENVVKELCFRRNILDFTTRGVPKKKKKKLLLFDIKSQNQREHKPLKNIYPWLEKDKSCISNTAIITSNF